MFTPQQIEQISFGRATFGGYDMQSVDEFLEPLTEDYVTLYKENALLKSKMRVLVAKLEEYRQNEASMKDAMVNAQKTCDKMVKEAEAKCAQMLTDAGAAAAESSRNADALISEENARVEEAKRAAAEKIETLEKELRACLDTLEGIKTANRPAPIKRAPIFDLDAQAENEDSRTDDVADEIALNLEALVGPAEDVAPKAPPQHPTNDTTTSKFANLQFGRNYESGRL